MTQFQGTKMNTTTVRSKKRIMHINTAFDKTYLFY